MRHLLALATLTGASLSCGLALLLGPGCSGTPDYTPAEGSPPESAAAFPGTGDGYGGAGNNAAAAAAATTGGSGTTGGAVTTVAAISNGATFATATATGTIGGLSHELLSTGTTGGGLSTSTGWSPKPCTVTSDCSPSEECAPVTDANGNPTSSYTCKFIDGSWRVGRHAPPGSASAVWHAYEDR